MSVIEAQTSNKAFLKIVDGKIRQKATAQTPGAVERKWEAGGRTGTTWEMPDSYPDIKGKIENVTFYEGESEGRKFTNLVITFDALSNGKVPVLSIGAETRYATDIMKKLPNVDFKEEVMLRPYAFTPEGEDKEKIGVEIKQRNFTGNFDKKIANYFHKKEGEKWIAVNGYPEPTEEDRDDWKLFYMNAHRFLVRYTRTNITSKFADKENFNAIPQPEEDINPEDIPF